MTPRRDWTSAGHAIEGKCCLVCGDPNVDAAHLWSRGNGGDESEANIAPLCREHHRAFDAGEVDLLVYLEYPAVAKVIELAAKSTQWRSNGMELARIRLLPSAYPSKRVERAA